MHRYFKRFLPRRAQKRARRFAYFRAATRLNSRLQQIGKKRRVAYLRRPRASELSVFRTARCTRAQNRQFAQQLPRAARLYTLRSNFMRFRHL